MPLAMTFLGGVIFEGRDLILQVTKSCQCRHRIATSLKDSFTFGAREADEPNSQSNHPAREATTQPAKRLPLEANDPARGAGDSIEPGAPAPRSRLEKRLSPRSGRQRKASTRCRPLRGLEHICWFVILGLAPQALCCRLLRRLRVLSPASQG